MPRVLLLCAVCIAFVNIAAPDTGCPFTLTDGFPPAADMLPGNISGFGHSRPSAKR
jgi:hypothetical protein